MIRAGLYIRVSTEEQVLHGYSLDAQRSALTKYAQEHGYLVVGYYTDEGASARKPFNKRPAFMQLLRDVESDSLDLILFIKLDRWFRSVKDYYKVQDVLEKHNVNWKTVLENYDTTTASGQLHINIMLSVAQNEADRTSERIKFVFQDKVRRGEVISGKIPRGYVIENKRLVPGDEKDIAMVRDIFEHFVFSGSYYSTASYVWNTYDWKPSAKTIFKLLQNTAYIGAYHETDGFCPGIIEPETFQRAQEILSGRTVKTCPTRRVYIFSGLLRCSECHRLLNGICNGSSSQSSYRYRCEAHYRQLCTRKSQVNEKVLEKTLLENIGSYVEQYLINYQAQAATPDRAKSERAKLTKKIEKLKDLYVNDLITLDEYKRDKDEYIYQLNQIQPVDTPKVNISNLEKFTVEDFRKSYLISTREEQRALWRGLIREVVMGANNKIESIIFT